MVRLRHTRFAVKHVDLKSLNVAIPRVLSSDSDCVVHARWLFVDLIDVATMHPNASSVTSRKSGEEGSRQSFLPSEKQYLQLRGVPSSQRASALESDFRRGTTEETTDEDGWVSAETGAKDTGVDLGSAAAPLSSAGVAAAGDDDDDGFDDLDGNDESTVAAALPPDAGTSGAADVADDDDEFLDLDSFGGEGLGADEATAVPEELAVAAAASGSASGAAAASCSDDFERGRSYDISIVYDRKYRVPRMFLFGYDEVGRLLEQHVQSCVSTRPFRDAVDSVASLTMVLSRPCAPNQFDRDKYVRKDARRTQSRCHPRL